MLEMDFVSLRDRPCDHDCITQKITKGVICFDCLFIIFFLQLKRKIFKMMPC